MTPAQLKAYRKALNWDLSETARRTGYSRSQLHNVEKGRYVVTPELVKALTDAVQASIAAQQKILKKLENSA